MSLVRYLIASAAAVATTFGIILLMHILIVGTIQPPGKVKEYKLPNILMPEREITTEYDTSKPDKPDAPEDAPPDIPDVEFENAGATNEGISVSKPVMDKPKIEGPGGFGDGEMIPLTVIQPEYPRRAAQRGTEGYCTVEFTVSAAGTTKDWFIVDCPDTVFERSSLKAAEKIKYKPRVVDGQAVDVPGVQYKFTYQMAKE
jgi:periplasmic protein TonB